MKTYDERLEWVQSTLKAELSRQNIPTEGIDFPALGMAAIAAARKPPKHNLTGQRFGKLVVEALIGRSTSSSRVIWHCKCDCGNVANVDSRDLLRGATKSCGCSHFDANKTHGMTKTPTYRIWAGLISRCYNPKSTSYATHGARGITVCDQWRAGSGGFEQFYADMGERPSQKHSIDRIDGTLGYAPENCRWALPGQQSNNLRTNIMIDWQGFSGSLAEVCRHFGFSYTAMYSRIQESGWSIEQAFTTPLKEKPEGYKYKKREAKYPKGELTQEMLKEFLEYNPDEGFFIWLKPISSRVRVGDVAGYKSPDGYNRIKVNGKPYGVHRLAVLYMLGHLPNELVDHINGIRNDNRWCNLREATRSENQRNIGKRAKNTSGYLGVGWHKGMQKWRAKIFYDGKHHFLGHFETAEEAARAYDKVVYEKWGEFAQLNFPVEKAA